ncbi:uncharacterized protein [Aegilops tauschii subsp. strangulata]|uniref:Uncharacterized protein n=1 Tax=Aegilops tauschii subsp. strangulata TaxID=200361 RepID=A0A453GEM5_AEGTS
MAKRSSVQAKHTISEFDKAVDRKSTTSHAPSDPQKDSFMEVDSPVTDYALYQFGTSGAIIAVATTVTHPLVLHVYRKNRKQKREVSRTCVHMIRWLCWFYLSVGC